LDSSVSAYLLKEQNFEVTGITLKFLDFPIYSEEDIFSLKQIATKLRIEHHTVDVRGLFSKKVIDYFSRDYSIGRTPNPCAVCNREVKFKILFEKAKQLDIQFVATGHYARIQEKGIDYNLLMGKDVKKDQSYFLARLKKQWLSRILFPVGEYTKQDVLAIARTSNLGFYAKKESQEVCFIKNKDYRKFLLKKMPELMKPGQIINKSGKVLGHHKGLFFYTIGQRKGIQVNINKPLYVISINSKENTVIVGEENDVFISEFITRNLNWLVSTDKIPGKVSVRIRSQHKPQNANIICEKDKVLVKFNKPQMAITPGQLAVFYKNDIVLGSGWIADIPLSPLLLERT